MAECKATLKTKEVLHGVVRLEATAIQPGYAAAKAAVKELMDADTPDPAALKEAIGNLSKLSGMMARVENVLHNVGDDTGTRNTAGGVITAIRKATGRDMVEEAKAALELVNRHGGIAAVREHFGEPEPEPEEG